MNTGSIGKIALSIFFLTLIGAQILASFGLIDRFRYWPFLSYPMYNQAHRNGEPISKYSLVGIRNDGSEVALAPADLKLSFWRYLRGPIRAFQRGDTRRLLADLESYEHRTRSRFAAIRLENRPVALVNGSPETLPVESQTLPLDRP